MKRWLAAAVTVLTGSLATGAELVSKAKGFAAEFPGPVRENAVPPPENAVGMTEWTSEAPGKAFLLTVIDFGPGDPYVEAGFDLVRDGMAGQIGALTEALLDFYRAGAVRDVKGGRLTVERHIRVAGMPAREFEVEAGSGQRLISRLVVDPATSRMYLLVVASRPQRLEPRRVAAFFDSFRLLPK